MVFSGVSLVLVSLPLTWHVRSRNVGTLSYMFYVFFGNLFFLVNSIVWFNNVNDPAPIWCDITAKFQIGMSVGIPAACLCISRRLYHIATFQFTGADNSNKRHTIAKELLLTAGLPILVMILHYIVQGRRYDIIEGVGCWAHTYWSWPAVWLVLQWPFTIGITSLAYGTAAFFVFRDRHRDWNENLRSKSLGITKSRYIRLMALSCAEMGFTLPLGFWVFYLSVSQTGINPWISWDYVHAHWYDIETLDDLLMKELPLEWTVFDLGRWTLPISAIAFFCFFGLSGEALREYGDALRYLMKAFHVPLPSQRNLEAGETFAQFNDRFVVDYMPPRSRKSNSQEEDDASSSQHAAEEPSALSAYVAHHDDNTTRESEQRYCECSTSLHEKEGDSIVVESTLPHLLYCGDQRRPADEIGSPASPASLPMASAPCCSCHSRDPQPHVSPPDPHSELAEAARVYKEVARII